MSNFNLSLTVPKALGTSSIISLNNSDTLLNILKNNCPSTLLDRILSNNTDFNRFVLIYLDGNRIKKSDTLVDSNHSEIEIIVPMAGG